MRKIFALLLLGLFIVPNAEAFVYRQQPSYSFRTSSDNNPTRFERTKWSSTSSRYNYRFVSTFKRSDYQRWRDLAETDTTETTTATSEDGYGTFCNYKDTILGEYLPTTEVTNRCCTCYDGWKCQIPVTANSTISHPCDSEWMSDNGYVD